MHHSNDCIDSFTEKEKEGFRKAETYDVFVHRLEDSLNVGSIFMYLFAN